MKMESPLEVLSRAASIVQKESKGIIPSPPAQLAGSSDSGIEDDLSTDYSDRSPKRPVSISPQTSVSIKRESSPERLFNAVQCLQKSQKRNENQRLSPKFIESHPKLSDDRSSNRCMSPNLDPNHPSPSPKDTKEIENPRLSPIQPTLIHREETETKYTRSSPKHADIYHHHFSPKHTENRPDLSPKRNGTQHPRSSPTPTFIKQTETQHPRSSPKHTEALHPHVVSPKRSDQLLRYPYSSPKRESQKPWLPPKPEINECARSPKRILDSDKKELKKIKLEAADSSPPSYERLAEKCCRKSAVPPTHDVMGAVPRFITPPGVLPSYSHSFPPYPPLFILTDKPTNYSKLMATYDSIFARPPHILPPTTLPPPYASCNCGDKNCKLVSPTVFTPPPPSSRDSPESSPIKEKPSERKQTEYAMPNVDEHFRKSLGAKYDVIKCKDVNEKPSSVDDHFAKALGQKWFSMEYGKS